MVPPEQWYSPSPAEVAEAVRLKWSARNKEGREGGRLARRLPPLDLQEEVWRDNVAVLPIGYFYAAPSFTTREPPVTKIDFNAY